jgi:uncharacterized protein
MMHDIDTLNAMTPGELAALLSGDGAQRETVLRAAAQGGAVEAQLLLGQLLLDRGQDGAAAEEAVRCFSSAATAGHAMGMNMLGRCLEHGWGVPADKAKAVTWYEAAAGRRLDWGMYNLATLLALGEGVPRDLGRALDLFRRAAALGHAKSMNMIGSFHEDGWVVEADDREAAAWYKRAAEGGDFRGQFNHARMLVDAGRIDAAIGWLRRIPRTATPRFLAQVRSWLDGRDEPRLRELPLDPPGDLRYASASQ